MLASIQKVFTTTSFKFKLWWAIHNWLKLISFTVSSLIGVCEFFELSFSDLRYMSDCKAILLLQNWRRSCNRTENRWKKYTTDRAVILPNKLTPQNSEFAAIYKLFRIEQKLRVEFPFSWIKEKEETSRGTANFPIIPSPQFWEQKLIMYIWPLGPISCASPPCETLLKTFLGYSQKGDVFNKKALKHLVVEVVHWL